MCSKTAIEFGRDHLKREEIYGKDVIEVGSRDVNGSLRPIIQNLQPSSYVGVDIEMGPGVDEICWVDSLVSRFGMESFDLLVCTEMVEHVKDWHSAFSQLKRVLKVDGIMLLTTRSFGFPYHDYPGDFWRYELDDMANIFSDMEIEVLESDPSPGEPGVFVKARKPANFSEKDLSEYKLYSMIKTKRHKRVRAIDMLLFKIDNNIVQRARNSFDYRIGKYFTK